MLHVKARESDAQHAQGQIVRGEVDADPKHTYLEKPQLTGIMALMGQDTLDSTGFEVVPDQPHLECFELSFPSATAD